MKVQFTNKLFIVSWADVKLYYRNYCNTIFDSSASSDKCMIIMLYQYTAQEART